MLRPRPAHWFEIITTRQDFALVMQEIAATGAAELEASPMEDARPVLPKLAEFYEQFEALKKTYQAYWPVPEGTVLSEIRDPAAVLEDALDTLHDWARHADPVIAEIQALETRRRELQLAEALIEATRSGHPFAGMPADEDSRLARAVYYLADADEFEPDADNIIVVRLPSGDGVFVMAIAEQAEMRDFEAQMQALRATPVPVPEVLVGDPSDHAGQIEAALAGNDRALKAARARLEALADQYALREVLSRISVLTWLYENIRDVQASERTIRITGWTNSATGQRLRDALDAAGANYVLSLARNPPSTSVPMVLQNPPWLKPFEFFPRLLGVPAAGEADPSAVTALIAPVMFGFMFGDVGQGAVLVGAGLYLRNRVPVLALLVPGGIAAMIFGVLFGSVFSREDVISPLWLHPLEEPATVLMAALVLGVVFLILGIALDFVQSVWRGDAAGWLWQHGGTVLSYISLLAAYWQPWLLWGLPAGIGLCALGARDDKGHRSANAIARTLGEYLETMMRLLVSTVSFVRVGAFALAHAGLSAAVVGIGEAAGGAAFWVILLLGNVLIIALEGLVSAIQTTRLILFEFFTRFFHAGGREFRPLRGPTVSAAQHEGNSA